MSSKYDPEITKVVAQKGITATNLLDVLDKYIVGRDLYDSNVQPFMVSKLIADWEMVSEIGCIFTVPSIKSGLTHIVLCELSKEELYRFLELRAFI